MTNNVLAFPNGPDRDRRRKQSNPQTPGTPDQEAEYTGPALEIDRARLTYTVDQVAYLLNLSRGVAYQYVREGVIPAQRVGRRWIVSRRRFHAWLDELSYDDGEGEA